MKFNHSKRNAILASILLLFALCCFWFLETNRPSEKRFAIKSSIENVNATGNQVSLSNAVHNILRNNVAVATNATSATFSLATNTTRNLSAKGDGQISASALKQIGALEAEKSRRTPVQQKIDSQLLYADKMRRGEPIAEGVATQRVVLDKDDQGRVSVDIKADVTDSLTGFTFLCQSMS